MDVENKFNYVFEDNNILLEKLVDFHFLKLIFGITNIIETYKLDIHSTTNATVFVLFKHLFEDFGYNQKYIYVDVISEKKDIVIIYKMKPILLEETSAEFLPLSFLSFTIITPHKIMVDFSIKCLEIPPTIENMIKTMLNTIFFKLKQYIDKL